MARKVFWLVGWSTPAWVRSRLKLVNPGRLRFYASYGMRDWFQDPADVNRLPKGNYGEISTVSTGGRELRQIVKDGSGDSTYMHRACTTGEAVTRLKNLLQRGITADSYMYVEVLKRCLKQRDLAAVKQVHDCINESGMEKNQYVASALLNVYVRSGRLLDARRVFDEIEKKSVLTWNMMIAAYAKNNHPEYAFKLFSLMRQGDALPDELTYVSTLKACASPLALQWGKEVHACIRHAGLELDVRVGTALVQMYARCGCIAEARRVFEKLTNRNSITWNVMIGAYCASGSMYDARLLFDSMESRDVVTWNIMIGAYAQRGRCEDAYRLYLQMKREGFKPDAITYMSILNAPANAEALDWVKEIHIHALRAGLESDLRVSNALVHMYVKSGSIDDARLIFDRMKTRDAITWNIIISAYSGNGCGAEARKLFLQMKREGFKPNVITYIHILNAFARAGALDWGKEVHKYILEAGLESDLRAGNALVHMYAKSGSIDGARLVFDKMGKRDVITWNTMIGAFAECGCGGEAYRLFLQMKLEGFEPDPITYVSILNACGSAKDLDWAKEVHSDALKAGLETDLRVGNSLIHVYLKTGNVDEAQRIFDGMELRDVFTWTMMIGAYAKYCGGSEAYRLFLQMKREGVKPDAFTYASILNSSAIVGALEWVKEVHGEASKVGFVSDLRVANALIHMYAKSGSIDDARLVFDRMQQRDVVTWNTMIGGLAQHGRGHDALELFREMNVHRVKPDGTSFVAVLSACCQAGLLGDGRKLFVDMTQDYGIEPTVVHYTCMVDLLGRAGHLEEAELVISRMPVQPVGVTWGALLGACRTFGNVELGERAAQKLLKLEPTNASGYVLLSNIYAAAGEWEKVSLLRGMMRERGVRKVPGRSWIEVDNKIHDFVVGDTSHPDAKLIYTELNKLTEKLKAEGYMPDTQLVLQNISEEEKELSLCCHSEKLAIAYGLMRIPRGKPIRVYKNLRVCSDCHTATKLISKVTGREIIARDANRFHHFKEGACSCGDYW